MAESITHSAKDAHEPLVNTAATTPERQQIHSQVATPGKEIIWTPRFIVIIAMVLIGGLSTASLVTQGWFNNFYSSGPALMLYTVPILICWTVLFRYAHARWLRWGIAFGYLWTLLSALYYRLNYGYIDPHIPVTLHMQAAIYSTLALAYICISLNNTPMSRWDRWFFRLSPLILCGFFLAQLALRFVFGWLANSMEAIIYTEILYFDLLVWWARPSCWKKQPGPTLLFGLIPFLQIALTFSPAIDEQVKFFFTQVSFIVMLLGILRLLQCELRH